MEILYAKWLFDGKKLLEQTSCVTHNNKVVDLLPLALAKKIYSKAVIKDFGNGVLFSGFVNAHMHLELSNIKIAPFLGFVEWLKRMINTKKQNNNEISDTTMKRIIQTQIQNGVCAVADISNTLISAQFLSAIPRAIVFFENYSLKKQIAQEKINYLENNIDKIKKDCKVDVFACAHSVYSTHADLLKYTMLKNNSKLANDLFSFHFLESEFENPFVNSSGDLFEMLQKDGLIEEKIQFSSAIEYIKSLGKIKKGLFVHCVHIKSTEIDYLKSINASIVICPRSNYFISKILPNVDLLKKSGINVAIGTDSLASNWDLNLINELKFLYKNYNHIEPSYFFELATLGGYSALNLNIGFKKDAFVYPFFMQTSSNNALEEILQ